MRGDCWQPNNNKVVKVEDFNYPNITFPGTFIVPMFRPGGICQNSVMFPRATYRRSYTGEGKFNLLFRNWEKQVTAVSVCLL